MSSNALRVVLLTSVLAACERPSADAPPAMRLGDAVCDECNMIISDERWATATMVQGPRGPEPRLFDDFNCQAKHEQKHADLEILARWSHDYASNAWLHTEDAFFVISPHLRTPMGSQAAAFASLADAEAEAAKSDPPGRVEKFDTAWSTLAPD